MTKLFIENLISPRNVIQCTCKYTILISLYDIKFVQPNLPKGRYPFTPLQTNFFLKGSNPSSSSNVGLFALPCVFRCCRSQQPLPLNSVFISLAIVSAEVFIYTPLTFKQQESSSTFRFVIAFVQIYLL